MTDVTVVVPTFRRPAQLLEAVRSALDQEGVLVEVRVVTTVPKVPRAKQSSRFTMLG